MQIKVKRLTDTAKLPTRAYKLDSGADIYIDHDLVLEPLQSHLASTGISLEIPRSLPNTLGNYDSTFEVTVRPKSGLSSKGLYVALGTIDNEYTGEIKVVLINLSNEAIEFKEGQKIAQLVVQRVYLPEVVEVTELEDRSRANKGFGSTGLN